MNESAHSDGLSRRTVLLATGGIIAGVALTGFRPSGVARASGSVLDVTSYGAIAGDGVTDDTAIAAAIAAASAGDTVYFPAGVYNISQSIVGKTGVRLAGASRDTTSIVMTGGTATAMVVASSVSSFEVCDLTLDGNFRSGLAQGILTGSSSFNHFHDLRIRNFVATTNGPIGIYLNTNANDCTIADNIIEQMGVPSTWGCGIRISNGSSRAVVSGNTITATGRGGVLVNSQTAVVQDPVIVNNVITASGSGGGLGLGIEVWGTATLHTVRAIVEDNVVDHWISISGADDCSVRRNTVAAPFAQLKYAGIELVDASRTIITDNTVTDGQRFGLVASNAPAKNKALIARNEITGVHGVGMLLQGNSGGMTRFYLHDNLVTGTTDDFNTSWYAYEGTAVSFDGNNHGVTLEGNTLSDNTLDGIRFLATGDLDFYAGGQDQLQFSGNSITNNLGAAVAGSPNPGSDVVWSANSATGNASNAGLTSSGFVGSPVSVTISASTPTAGLVSFSSTVVNASGTVEYLWDFGQGIASAAANPSFTYTGSGTFQVTCIVWDGRVMSARSTVTVVV